MKYTKEQALNSYQESVQLFNSLLRCDEITGYGANFKWVYNEQGKKELALCDVALLEKPSDEAVAKARTEVPEIMKQAESLVDCKVEIAQNEPAAE